MVSAIEPDVRVQIRAGRWVFNTAMVVKPTPGSEGEWLVKLDVSGAEVSVPERDLERVCGA